MTPLAKDVHWTHDDTPINESGRADGRGGGVGECRCRERSMRLASAAVKCSLEHPKEA